MTSGSGKDNLEANLHKYYVLLNKLYSNINISYFIS